MLNTKAIVSGVVATVIGVVIIRLAEKQGLI